MITTLMAGFAFGYCVVDFALNIYTKKQNKKQQEYDDSEVLKTIFQIHRTENEP